MTIAHSRTVDLPERCREADIVVAAVGRPEMVRGQLAQTRRHRHRCRDQSVYRTGGWSATWLTREAARNSRCAITPVPGGVGPMTIACLLENTVNAAMVTPLKVGAASVLLPIAKARGFRTFLTADFWCQFLRWDDGLAGLRRLGVSIDHSADLVRRLSVRNWPQAARMSRPRGTRMGEANPASCTMRAKRLSWLPVLGS